MKKASIDIGTNSVLLLVADKTDGKLSVIHEMQEIPRLGKGVDNDRKLSADSQRRVINVLIKYRDFLFDHYPGLISDTIVTATSAVRDAGNREIFINQVYQETGWTVVLLSGKEEAKTTYRGALSVLDYRSDQNNVVLDIGGGSTEIAFGSGNKLSDGFSIDMGSVRFTERFFKHNPPHKNEIDEVGEIIQKQFIQQKLPYHTFDAIGVAGTITSIAAIHRNLKEYDANLLNNTSIHRDVIQYYINKFSKMSAAEIEEKYPVFLSGRGDVILAGMLILDGFLEWCKKYEIVISTGGIRHGMLV